MTWSEITLVVLAALAVLMVWAWVQANRLDRLHRKVGASRVALDSQLLRRAGSVADIATSGVVDPASSVLMADAAYAVIDDAGAALRPEQALHMDGLGPERERLESALTATLREAFADPEAVTALRSTPPGDTLVANLGAAWYRAQLARRFHNDAVAQAQRVRRHWYVRFLHLAGRAPVPQTVELDDQMPEGLSVPAQN